ncbi:MAG: COQ9 family protein [Pseudomonadota bacterium]
MTDDKRRLLETFLDLVPFEGWTRRALRKAEHEANLPTGAADEAFPRGPRDAVSAFAEFMDEQMAAKLAEMALSDMRIRDRIRTAVLTRLEVMEPYRDALGHASRFMVFPQYGSAALRSVSGTVDAIWRGIGDTSTDFNFYTKRAILAGVYLQVFRVWLGDDHPDHVRTGVTLDREIDRVMQIEKVKSRVRKLNIPVLLPLKVVSAMRYPALRRPAGSSTD